MYRCVHVQEVCVCTGGVCSSVQVVYAYTGGVCMYRRCVSVQVMCARLYITLMSVACPIHTHIKCISDY